MLKTLDFQPLPGLSSPHLQMFFANFGPTGEAPPSKSKIILLEDGDKLCCEVSTPENWQPDHPTIAFVHGVGGSHLSSYMIRLARKFHAAGIRAVRINLRGAGSGHGLCKLPYNCGNSKDVWTVLEALKKETPNSSISLVGFSLGGSLILKMAGELGDEAKSCIDRVISICPVLDLIQTTEYLSHKSNWLYHQYYVDKVCLQGQQWIKELPIPTLKAFDEQVTAPLWGYKNANDYYEKCSSYKFISRITVPCDIILAIDDPFIDHKVVERSQPQSSTNIWLTEYGGHMGYIGSSGNMSGIYWMDKLLFEWLGPKTTVEVEVKGSPV